MTARSGRSVRAPSRLIEEVGASALGLTKAEDNYYTLLDQGVKLNLIQRSLFALEQHLEEDLKILKIFISRSTKKP
jgi:hypothetical protein